MKICKMCKTDRKKAICASVAGGAMLLGAGLCVWLCNLKRMKMMRVFRKIARILEAAGGVLRNLGNNLRSVF